MGTPQSGNQRSSSGSIGSSPSICALSCSSRSTLRCCSPGGHERVPGAALDVVDEVDGPPLAVLEGEHGGQHTVAVAAERDRLVDRVDGDDQVLDLVVADDHPAVAEAVVARLDRGAGLLARRPHDLLHLRDDLREVGGRQRLEDDGGHAARAHVVARLQRDVRRRHGEQAVTGRRRGRLATAQQCVEESHEREPTRRGGRPRCPAAAAPGAAGGRCAARPAGASRTGWPSSSSPPPG